MVIIDRVDYYQVFKKGRALKFLLLVLLPLLLYVPGMILPVLVINTYICMMPLFAFSWIFVFVLFRMGTPAVGRTPLLTAVHCCCCCCHNYCILRTVLILSVVD